MNAQYFTSNKKEKYIFSKKRSFLMEYICTSYSNEQYFTVVAILIATSTITKTLFPPTFVQSIKEIIYIAIIFIPNLIVNIIPKIFNWV
jgi:hypothetical protein